MTETFLEYYEGKTGLTIGIREKLFDKQTPYQRVEVFDTDAWGHLLTIDGMVMLSERDEFVYHEMISHVPLFMHPAPKRVLVIGGGDGGTVREVLKHRTVEHVDLVEIDEAVVEASKLHFPGLGVFEHPKLSVTIGDGIGYVAGLENAVDLIIVDGSDPTGPAEGLFSESFFRDCERALKPGGILVAQNESPWVPSYQPAIRAVMQILAGQFPYANLYLSFIPLYPAGMWGMALASKGGDPLDGPLAERLAEDGDFLEALRYYNPELHRGAFALPNFVRQLIEE